MGLVITNKLINGIKEGAGIYLKLFLTFEAAVLIVSDSKKKYCKPLSRDMTLCCVE